MLRIHEVPVTPFQQNCTIVRCEETGQTCLPIGAFPGSPCRSDANSPCDPLDVGGDSAPMACVEGQCAVVCDDGGTALCEGVADGLSCATGVFDTAYCLPNGSYPGGPCDADDALDHRPGARAGRGRVWNRRSMLHLRRPPWVPVIGIRRGDRRASRRRMN